MGCMDCDAVFLDAGGVLVLPNVDVFADVFAAAGITLPREQDLLNRAHYLAMRAVDAGPPDAAALHYLAGILEALGLGRQTLPAAASAMRQLADRPSSGVWNVVPPGTLDGLRALEATGVALAVVSNADGTVEESLRNLGLCQVGEGPGVGICVVVDSFVVEAEKPLPEIFAHALASSGSRPDRTLHVGDGVRYDVQGARAAGIRPMHFDPFALCDLDDHPHVASLVELAHRLSVGV
jgi:putative hydrolase of the HAD superfamily